MYSIYHLQGKGIDIEAYKHKAGIKTQNAKIIKKNIVINKFEKLKKNRVQTISSQSNSKSGHNFRLQSQTITKNGSNPISRNETVHDCQACKQVQTKIQENKHMLKKKSKSKIDFMQIPLS